MTSKKLLHSKDDFQSFFLKLSDPLKPFYSEGSALLNLGRTSTVYTDHVARMEGFCRLLWGFAPFLAGEGADSELLHIYRSGLIHGTDPSHPEYWGGFTDYDQRFVEMAAIAFGLMIAPEQLWAPLTASEKQNLYQWLDGINHYECVPNNWQFFCVLVNAAFCNLGLPYNQKRLDDSLNLVDSFYLSDGWYTDGANGQTDYYIGFAIHFYSLIYAKFMKEADPVRSRRFLERAALFAGQFIYWFDDSGIPVPFGRSLTYRFAQISFFTACVWAGVDAFPLPVMKGIITRHLQSWMEEDICDHAGVLTLGYGYPNLRMCEEYNSPGSPYWCMKAFIFLALEDSHTFWDVFAAPLPELNPVKWLPAISALAQRLEGQAVYYPPGSRIPHKHHHTEAKYSKFAYASQMGFHIAISSKTLIEAAPDNMLAFDLSGQILVRSQPDSFSSDAAAVSSIWSPINGIRVTTTVIPDTAGHRRIHLIESDYECQAYECGFPIPLEEGIPCQQAASDSLATITGSRWTCTVKSLNTSSQGHIIEAAPNTNIMYSKAIIPSVCYQIHQGIQTIETHISLQPVQ